MKQKIKFNKTTKEIVRRLRPIDDTFFRVIAADKEACEEMLRTFLDDDELEVLEVMPQKTITSLHREVVLDVLCRLGNGKIVNMEVQKDNKNDDIRRTRYHLSTITANLTPKGCEFKDIPDVTIVYISE